MYECIYAFLLAIEACVNISQMYIVQTDYLLYRAISYFIFRVFVLKYVYFIQSGFFQVRFTKLFYLLHLSH